MITLDIGAILLAAFTAFMFGWLWYSPLLFQKPWMRMAHIPQTKPSTNNMASTMGLGFFSYAVIAGTIDVLFQIIGVGSLLVALQIALLCWGGFIATTSLGMVTWEGKPWKLYLLNNGYSLIAFLLMGAIVFSVA